MSTWNISCIVKDNESLENVIQDLIGQSVGRHDIAVQGSTSAVMDATGREYVAPKTLQRLKNKPMQEPFMEDDFGWVIGLTFIIPVMICTIAAVFWLGDIMSTSDNIFYGVTGVLVGSVIGGALAYSIYQLKQKKVKKQEQKGGFLLEVTAHDDEQRQKCIELLEKHHAKHIQQHQHEG